jgi:hypothetical protein
MRRYEFHETTEHGDCKKLFVFAYNSRMKEDYQKSLTNYY